MALSIYRARVLEEETNMGIAVGPIHKWVLGCWKKENARRRSEGRLFIDFNVRFSTILIGMVRLFMYFLSTRSVGPLVGQGYYLPSITRDTPVGLPHAFLGRLSLSNTSGRLLTRAKSFPPAISRSSFGHPFRAVPLRLSGERFPTVVSPVHEET